MLYIGIGSIHCARVTHPDPRLHITMSQIGTHQEILAMTDHMALSIR